MKFTLQEILNAVRVDGSGSALSVVESTQDAFNAVLDHSADALRVYIDPTSDVYTRLTALEDN